MKMIVPDRARHARTVVIGLLWHAVNSDNLGVGALTVAQIAILEEIAKGLGIRVEFHVIGWFDKGSVYVSGANIRTVPIRGRSFVSFRDNLIHAFRRCDVVCDIGAGDSFADIYGARRFLYHALSKAMVLAARRPLILSPQTLGPFNRGWTSLLARQIMRRCRWIAVRDDLSMTLIEDVATRKFLSTDVAFRLPYSRTVMDPSLIHIGLNVSGLLFNGGYNRQNMFGLRVDYPAMIEALMRHFTALPDCRVHLIGHVNSDTHVVEDDRRVALALAEAYPDAVVAPRFASPSEAKSYISGMDYFCGSRMHACIAALSSGVPVLPVAYSRKFRGLFGSLGYHHYADCQSEETGAIVAKVIDGFENRAALRAAAALANENAIERLAVYEDALRETLASLAVPAA